MTRTQTVAVVLIIFGVIGWFVFCVAPKSPMAFGVMEHAVGPVIPGSFFAKNLDSSDPDLVRESLAMLSERADPVGVPRAIPLLQSSDDYIWLNAAIYLGVCKRPEAIPWLIKALRHTAWRSNDKEAACLHDLTGQDFGTDFSAWQKWWVAGHAGAAFDWTLHLGFSPRIGSPAPSASRG